MYLIKKSRYSFILWSYVSKKIVVFVVSWHRKKEPVGEPLMPSCLYTGLPWGKSIRQVALMFGAVISLRWRGAAGEGVETVHPPGGRISLLAMFILIHILSSWHHHRDHYHDYAPAQQACGKVWANCWNLAPNSCVACLSWLCKTHIPQAVSFPHWLTDGALNWLKENCTFFSYLSCASILCWKFLFCWHW